MGKTKRIFMASIAFMLALITMILLPTQVVAETITTEVTENVSDKSTTLSGDSNTSLVNGESVQYFGQRSFYIINLEKYQDTWGYQTINTTELAGKDVTFSAYVKTERIVPMENTEENSGVYLKLEFYNSNDELIGTNRSYAIYGDNSWQRMSVTGFAPESTTKIRVCFGVDNASGNAWFDCLQCEEASCMNDFNLLSNSDFTLNTSWDYWNHLTGDTMLAKSVNQTVNVNKSNVSFNMTGTAQADSVPLKDNRTFVLSVPFSNRNGIFRWHSVRKIRSSKRL